METLVGVALMAVAMMTIFGAAAAAAADSSHGCNDTVKTKVLLLLSSLLLLLLLFFFFSGKDLMESSISLTSIFARIYFLTIQTIVVHFIERVQHCT